MTGDVSELRFLARDSCGRVYDPDRKRPLRLGNSNRECGPHWALGQLDLGQVVVAIAQVTTQASAGRLRRPSLDSRGLSNILQNHFTRGRVAG